MLRRFKGLGIMLLAISIMLAACSSGTNEENTAAGTSSTQTEGEASTTEEAANESATKVVQDQFGEVTIPTHPQNLVVFDSIYAEYLIEMGVTPQIVLLTRKLKRNTALII